MCRRGGAACVGTGGRANGGVQPTTTGNIVRIGRTWCRGVAEASALCAAREQLRSCVSVLCGVSSLCGVIVLCG